MYVVFLSDFMTCDNGPYVANSLLQEHMNQDTVFNQSDNCPYFSNGNGDENFELGLFFVEMQGFEPWSKQEA